MLANEVESTFPSGIPLPTSIRALCDYLDANDYPLSGCFEISTLGQDDMKAWFPNDIAMQQSFAVFGHGSTGSVYAIWLQNSNDADNSPVIVLGSEGELLVLATTPLHFCRLLGCGYNELEWDDLSVQSEDWDDTQPLRDWLASRLEIDFPTTGQQIVTSAQQQFPNFQSHIQSWWDANT